MTETDAPRPPQAPDMPRSFRMSRAQWFMIPILLLIPLLALAGVFGEGWQTATDTDNALALRVEFPERYSYKMVNTIRVEVTNQSEQMIDTVSVAFDPTYIARYSGVVFTPSVDRAYQITLTDVGPRDTRLVTTELQAEQYGRHGGWIRATAGADTARVEIHTIIFP